MSCQCQSSLTAKDTLEEVAGAPELGEALPACVALDAPVHKPRVPVAADGVVVILEAPAHEPEAPVPKPSAPEAAFSVDDKFSAPVLKLDAPVAEPVVPKAAVSVDVKLNAPVHKLGVPAHKLDVRRQADALNKHGGLAASRGPLRDGGVAGAINASQDALRHRNCRLLAVRRLPSPGGPPRSGRPEGRKADRRPDWGAVQDVPLPSSAASCVAQSGLMPAQKQRARVHAATTAR